MNCTEKEFVDKVCASKPIRGIYSCNDHNGRFVFSYELGYRGFANYSLQDQINASDFVWFNGSAMKDTTGSVIKDTDGLFAFSQYSLAPSGPVILTTPLTPSDVFTVKTVYGDISVRSSGSGKSPAKCECGAHSVGSNRHSSYCPLDKENF
jgi:hypothetical protein